MVKHLLVFKSTFFLSINIF